MIHIGAIHSDLEQARSEVIALADLLEHIPASGAMEKQTPAGLSRLAWHIAKDIEAVQREIEERGEA
jgi:hypothetical protein